MLDFFSALRAGLVGAAAGGALAMLWEIMITVKAIAKHMGVL